MDIGLDIDGVIYPFHAVMAEWSSARLGRPLDAVPRSWNYYGDQWGIGSEEFVALWGEGVRAGVIYSHGLPVPGALTAAVLLKRSGHRLHYVTAREVPGYVTAPLAWERTARWLMEWGFPVDSLTVTNDKADRRTDVFLDDAAHNYDALATAGHPCPVLWSQPHNSGHPGRRVREWDEFVNLVDDLAAPLRGAA